MIAWTEKLCFNFRILGVLTNESILENRSLGTSLVVFEKGGFLFFNQFGKAKVVTGHL